MTDTSPGRRLNVVYLHSHDTGRYVSPYGFAVPTPHYQALAESGTVFRRAFAAAPTCSPSRAAMLTGQAAHATGMLGLAHRGFGLTHPDRHLGAVLQGAGYTTVLTGMQHLARDRTQRTYYDRDVSDDDTSVAAVVPRATAQLAELAAAGAPFFLDVGFFETHRPYPAPGPDNDPRYLAPPLPIPDTPVTRADMAGYHTSVRELDRGAGAVLDAIDRLGLADSTLVVATTDHGLAFPGMKSTLTAHGTGVLLIMRLPGVVPAGAVVDGLVSHLDVFPTVCDLLGIPAPGWLEGHSLRPLLNGTAERIRDAVFNEVTYHAAYEPQRAVRTDRWAYVRRFHGRDRRVLPNVDASPARDLWLGAGWDEREVPEEQLYDTLLDPTEATNLAGDPRFADVLAGLRDRLGRWMRETDDPLLAGDVPLPPGGVTNDPAGRSPDDPLFRAGADGTLEPVPPG